VRRYQLLRNAGVNPEGQLFGVDVIQGSGPQGRVAVGGEVTTTGVDTRNSYC